MTLREKIITECTSWSVEYMAKMIDKLIKEHDKEIHKQIKENRPKEIEQPSAGIYREQDLDARIKLSVGYNQALSEYDEVIDKLFR